MAQRISGFVQVQGDGVIFDAKGEWEYNLGVPKRTPVMGSDNKLHGYKEEAQVAYLQGALTDKGKLDIKKLASGDNLTVTAELANGKTVVLGSAYYAGEGTVKTGESEVDVRWECDPDNAQET